MSKPFVPVYENDLGPHVRPYPPDCEHTPGQYLRMEESRIDARTKNLARMLSQSGTTPLSARATKRVPSNEPLPSTIPSKTSQLKWASAKAAESTAAKPPALRVLDNDQEERQKVAARRDNNMIRAINGDSYVGDCNLTKEEDIWNIQTGVPGDSSFKPKQLQYRPKPNAGVDGEDENAPESDEGDDADIPALLKRYDSDSENDSSDSENEKDEKKPNNRAFGSLLHNLPRRGKASKLSATKRRKSKTAARMKSLPKPQAATNEDTKPAFDVINPPKKMNDGGLAMSLRNKGANITKSAQYVCSSYRRNKCDRQLKVDSKARITFKGEHKMDCYLQAGVDLPAELKDEVPVLGHDYFPEMHARVTKLAEETNDYVEKIWAIVNTEFREKGGPSYRGMRKEQVRDLVKNTRKKKIGGDAISKVEAEFCGTKAEGFLRHSSILADTKCLQRMMCFAMPELLKYLLYQSVQIFVDATFACVPSPFYQCLVVMVYDQALHIYIPVMYILMTGKTEECYHQAFTYIRGELPDCDPYCIGVDFERAFFTAAGLFFPEAHLVGCLFHFKQAARRKMIDLGIPECEVQIAMQFGVYDLLTVLPKDELDKKGIPFIQTMIMDLLGEYYMTNKPEDKAWEKKWDTFWVYFRSFWMQDTFLNVWNVHDMEDDDVDLSNRTSNGLERYNRKLGREVFTTSHPSLGSFASSLRNEGDRVVGRIEDVRKGRERAREYQGRDVFPPIPEEYNSFRSYDNSPKKKRSKRRGARNGV